MARIAHAIKSTSPAEKMRNMGANWPIAASALAFLAHDCGFMDVRLPFAAATAALMAIALQYLPPPWSAMRRNGCWQRALALSNAAFAAWAISQHPKAGPMRTWMPVAIVPMVGLSAAYAAHLVRLERLRDDGDLVAAAMGDKAIVAMVVLLVGTVAVVTYIG